MDPRFIRDYWLAAISEGIAKAKTAASDAATFGRNAWDDVKADPIGAAKHAGYGIAAGTLGAPMDIARLANDASPTGIARNVVARRMGAKQLELPEKTPGGTDWLLDRYAPEAKTAGEKAAQFGGTMLAPSPQSVVQAPAKTVRKIFAGTNAKTANLEELELAKKLEKDGVDPAEIWKSTGWGRSPGDGQWRYEIDDSAARVKREPQRGDPDVLGATVHHPELFKAYPDMRRVAVTRGDDARNLGSHNLNSPFFGEKIEMGPNALGDQFLSTLLHEKQHAVQSRSGFAYGTSPEAMRGTFQPLHSDPETLKAADKMAYDLYRTNAGEAEARLVQRRQHLSPEDRREAFPFKQSAYGYDVDPEQLHTIAGRGKAASRVVEKPKEVKVAKRFKEGDKAGVYRGTEAFGGITPSKLGSMRTKYLEKMDEGAPGRLWYDKTSDDILRLTGGDTKKADELANILAVTSSSTGVGVNTNFAFKGWNQRATGDKLNTGRYPKAMGESIDEALATDAGSASGLKRSPFSAGLSVAWRGPEFASRPVHDIWDVRAWEIKDPKTGEPWSKGVGPAGHRFLDEQGDWVTKTANERKVGGVDDWLPYRSQAAAWVAMKARKEGIPIEEAAKHYGDFIDDYSAQVTRSWVPGSNTGHLPELLDHPELQKPFSDALEGAVAGPQGIDLVAHRLGALSDRTLPNAGLYEGVVEPGFASRIPVGKKTGSHDMDASSEKMVRGVAAAHGLLGIQKQSAYNFAGGPAPQKKAGIVRVKTGKPIEGEALRPLQEELAKHGADIAQVDPRGARALVFDELSTAQVKQLQDAARRAGGEAEFLTRHGDVFPRDDNFNAPEKWSAQPYIDEIRAAGLGEAFDRGVAPIAGDLLTKTEAFAKQHGMTQAPWYRPMMEGLQKGGLGELQRLVKAGIVPAAAVAALLPLLQGHGEPDA